MRDEEDLFTRIEVRLIRLTVVGLLALTLIRILLHESVPVLTEVLHALGF